MTALLFPNIEKLNNCHPPTLNCIIAGLQQTQKEEEELLTQHHKLMLIRMVNLEQISVTTTTYFGHVEEKKLPKNMDVNKFINSLFTGGDC